MVAIVTGSGLGLDRASNMVIGSRGQVSQLGTSNFGRYGENIYLNAANGNLMVQRTDEILIGTGPDEFVTRGYNSESANQGYGSSHGWQWGDGRCITNLTGQLNQNGSTVTRIDRDGSDTVYTWNAASNAYVCKQAGEKYDHLSLTLSIGNGTSVWTWKDTRTGLTEKYDNQHGGRLMSSTDTDGNSLTYAYDSNGHLSTVSTQSGEVTTFDWAGGTLNSLTTTISDGQGGYTTLKRTRYNYDNQGRLSQVVTDLSPENGSIADGNDVATTYTYDGTSDRIASIQQTGGAQITFHYTAFVTPSGSLYKVDTITQTTADGVTSVTQFNYQSGYTVVTDANGKNTKLTFDAKNQLTQVDLPAAIGGAQASIAYSYNTDGSLASATDGDGHTTTYSYDNNDNITEIKDALGNLIDYTYDANNNLIIETHKPGAGQAGSQQTIRYAYDSENHLRFVVSGDGRVTEYQYKPVGAVGSMLVYSNDHYDVSGLSDSQSLSESTLSSWAASINDKRDIERTDYHYDFRSNLSEAITYSACNQDGTGDGTQPATVVDYVYDQYGNLLTRQTAGISNQQAWTYDGLGRVLTHTDVNGLQSTVLWNDAGNKCTVTFDNGLTEVSNYDLAGRLIASHRSGNDIALTTTNYYYDSLGQLVMTRHPGGSHSYSLYDNDGRKVADIADDGSIIEYRYDLANNLVASIGYVNKVDTDLLVDGLGNPSTPPLGSIRPATDANDVWNWRIYDADNRVIETIDGDGAAIIVSYDNDGNVLSTEAYYHTLDMSAYKTGPDDFAPPVDLVVPQTSSLDDLTRNFYDHDGHLVGTLNGDGYLTQYVYDDAGRQVETIAYATLVASNDRNDTFNQLLNDVGTATADIHTHYVYDGRGELRYKIDANCRPTEYGYNDAGHLLHTFDYDGEIAVPADWTVEAVAAKITNAIGNGSITDENTRKSWSVYNPHTGALAFSVDSEGGVTRYVHDTAGNLTKVVQLGAIDAQSSDPDYNTIKDFADAHEFDDDTRITRSFYDDAGRLRFTVDAEGYLTEYDYNFPDQINGEIRYASPVIVDDQDSVTSIETDILPAIADDPDNVSTSTVYSGALVTDRYDANGVRTHYVYDGLERVTDETVAYGTSSAVTTHYVYDTGGRVISRIDAYGADEQVQTDYTYDGMGHLLSQSDSYAADETVHYRHYSYDAVGNLVTSKDQQNKETSYTYDAFGNRLTTTDPLANTSYSFYNNLNQLVAEMDPDGAWTAFTYTIGGALASSTQGATLYTGPITPGILPEFTLNASHDAQTQFGRDKLDRLTIVTDAENNTESYVLDAFGDRTTVTNKLGYDTTNTYDRRGLLVSETLPIIAYDAENNIISNGVENTYAYDARGNRVQMTEGAGSGASRVTTYQYDKRDRLVLTTYPEVHYRDGSLNDQTTTPTESLVYDSRGNIIESVAIGGAKTYFYYDELNRKVGQIDALGAVTTWSYDGAGHVLSQRQYDNTVSLPSQPGGTITLPQGGYRETTYSYWADGMLYQTTVSDLTFGAYGGTQYILRTGEPEITTRVYDAANNVIRLTDGRSTSIRYYYDKAGHKVGQLDQDLYLTVYDVDAMGNVTKETRFTNASTIEDLNDSTTLDELKASVAPDQTNDRVTSFTYDRNGRRLTETRASVAYDTINTGTGALLGHNGSSTVTYTYNALGEIQTKAEATGDTVTYAYDKIGRVSKVTHTAFLDYTGASVSTSDNFKYGTLNNVVREWIRDASGTGVYHLTTSTYDTDGRLSSTTDASGFQKNYFYDKAGRVTLVSYDRQHSDGSTTTEGTVTQYDALGRVVLQTIATSTNEGQTWSTTHQDKSETIYNAHGEVIARQINGVTQQTYDYDSAGRLWRETDEGVTHLYMYDKSGNQTLDIESSGQALKDGYDWNTLTIEDAIAILTDSGVHTIGGYNANADGLTTTITKYDARDQAIEVRQPFRQLTSTSAQTLVTDRAYNAFGEVVQDTDANRGITQYSYNTMGRLTQQSGPTVDYTDESGSTHTDATPTQKNFYDISGRLIGVDDANGHRNTRTLLANTGYDGTDALVDTEFHADGGRFKNAYDLFGDVRQTTNELGNSQTYTYDAMDRLTVQTHELRSSDGRQLVDHYSYDGLGQRLTHYNSEMQADNTETTDYDAQGRITTQVSMGCETTTYAYVWSSSATATGLGTFGGWAKTTVNSSNKTETETFDGDGRTIGKTDFGSETFTYGFDVAGRLITRHNSYGDGQGDDRPYEKGETVDYTYYNTGLIATEHSGFSTKIIVHEQEDDYPSEHTDDLTATYTYDKNGNRLSEDVVHETYDEVHGDNRTTVEDATANYDSHNRMISLDETVAGDAATMTWKYDLNGNVRERYSSYRPLNADGSVNTNGSPTTQDDWYTYDSMNRFTVTRGRLSGSQIEVDQYTPYGATLTYDAAGERKTAVNGADGKQENYIYTEDGYLAEVDVGTGTKVERASYQRDAMGRVTMYDEYNDNGSSVVYSKQSWYDTDSNVTKDEVSDARSDANWVWTTTYDYKLASGGDAYNGAYMGGVVTHSRTVTTKNNVSQPTSDTDYLYGWTDNTSVGEEWYKPDESGNTDYHSQYVYDKRGALTQAQIDDGRPRVIDYTNGVNGEVFKNDMNVSSSPATLFYWFDGVQQGEVSNNGTDDVDYVQSIARHTTAPPQNPGFYRNGGTSAVAYADFDASYQPINGSNWQGASSSYTVRQGDTLQSIAQAIWGDASFWYRIADANGLNTSSDLAVGETLILPNKVANASNNSGTYRVYDPNLYTGDTSPTHPPKPVHDKGCGVVGQIIETVVAVAVTYFFGPIAGDAAKQLTAMALGDQSKFNWKELGVTAATAVLVGPGDPAGGLLETVAHAAVYDAVYQGLNIAVGNQKSFDWGQVGISAVSAGVMHEVSENAPFGSSAGDINLGSANINAFANSFSGSMAGAMVGATARTLIKGTDFGDNLLATLPDVIGNSVGNAIAASMMSPVENTQAPQAGEGGGQVGQRSAYGGYGGLGIAGTMGLAVEASVAEALQPPPTETVVVTAPRMDFFQKLMFDAFGDGGYQTATNIEQFLSSAATNIGQAQINQAQADRAAASGIGNALSAGLHWMGQPVLDKEGRTIEVPVFEPWSGQPVTYGPSHQELMQTVTNGDLVNAGLAVAGATAPVAAMLRGAGAVTEVAGALGTSDVEAAFQANSLRLANEAHDLFAQGTASGSIRLDPNLSYTFQAGQFMDKAVRLGNLTLRDELGLDASTIRINQRLYAPDGSYTVPDLYFPESGNIIDYSYQLKTIETPQIQGFFNASPAGTVTIVPPSAVRPVYTIGR